MCLAVPRRVLEVCSGRALVDVDGRRMWVSASGVMDVRPDEYVLVYAGHAVDRLTQPEAEELLHVYASLETSP